MSTMSDTPTKFLLTEDRIPTHWINLLPDLPGEPLPPLHPGTMQPAGPPDPRDHPAARPAGGAGAAAASRHHAARRAARSHADLPDGAHRAGGVVEPRGRDPRRGPRRIPAVAADAAVPRAAPRAGARYA